MILKTEMKKDLETKSKYCFLMIAMGHHTPALDKS